MVCPTSSPEQEAKSLNGSFTIDGENNNKIGDAIDYQLIIVKENHNIILNLCCSNPRVGLK